MEGAKPASSLLVLVHSAYLCLGLTLYSIVQARGDYIPPAKPPGFVYQNRPFNRNTVLIEAFYDPVCPDSRDSWPPLKQVLSHYGSRVNLVVHLLPLPYHDNAFVASRALHVVNALNTSATFPLLEWIFKHQEKYYGAPTRNFSRAFVVEEMVKSATEVVGESFYDAVKSGFDDVKTDYATRVSFKYAASRGVYGTPFFYVNGFLLPDTGSALDYNAWRKVIDPLLGVKSGRTEQGLHFFL